MKIVKLKLSQIKPYENNPRRNDNAVDAVVESIKQCGYCSPILLDENNVILAGHTRYKALQKLGWEEVEVVVRSGLTDDQKRKYRLLDNKTNELAEWDFDLLAEELEGIDFGGFDFGFRIDSEGKEGEEKYSVKTDIPQYEPSDENWEIGDLYDDQKTNELIEEINRQNIDSDTKLFLIKAAYRHTRFNYKKIADFYSKASKEVQSLMEESALVIIDYDDAIKNGYTNLDAIVGELRS